ncbi:MAG: type II secretion system ATPase GspE [Geminicoccaceae bacterium]
MSVVEEEQDFDERFGEVLVRHGKLDVSGLQRALRASKAGEERLHGLLPKLGMVSEKDVAEALAEALQLQLAGTADYPDEPVHDEALSVNFLKSSKIVPLSDTDTALTVAMADPLDDYAINSLRLYARKIVATMVGVPADIESALERLFGQGSSVGDMVDEVDGVGDSDLLDDVERLRDLASEAPVVRIVNRLIANAVEQRASDIHIEPFEQNLRVRYRIDGLLKDGETVSRDLHAAMISRLKIMASLNIAERRLPQDGRIKLTVRGRDIDLRVATMPIMHGEAVVLRILDRGSVQLDFGSLGFSEHALGELRRSLDQPNGIVLVTGPTGSGKTTTLYTSLLELNTVDRKVLTVEDPIEYQLEGINQVQIRPQIDLTFASVLRAMLRHDPDVIMVGEIRDLETAEIAIQAALTGHLVLSTLHTNSAAATLMRLMDMGVEAFLLASTLNVVVAQRLVRCLCEACRESYRPLPDMLRQLGLKARDKRSFWRPRGCEACRQTGYRGRVGIHEVLVMQDAVRQEVLRGVDAGALHRAACKAGMMPMIKDGIEKAGSGVTTIEEVLRVTREVE